MKQFSNKFLVDILKFFTIPLMVFVAAMFIANKWPKVDYQWVYIKANGEITKGTVYEGDNPREDSNEYGTLPADGLLLVTEKTKGVCTRTYQLKNEILYFFHAKDDLTKEQLHYGLRDKLLALTAGSPPRLYHGKHIIINGVRLIEIYEWKEYLGTFSKQQYRIKACKGIHNCSYSIGNLYSGWTEDDYSLGKKIAQRYENEKLMEKFLYSADLKSTVSVKKIEAELDAKSQVEILALRKKFKNGLNIKDERYETCSYWWG